MTCGFVYRGKKMTDKYVDKYFNSNKKDYFQDQYNQLVGKFTQIIKKASQKVIQKNHLY